MTTEAKSKLKQSAYSIIDRMDAFLAQKLEDKKTEDKSTQAKSDELLERNPEILQISGNFDGILSIVGALYALENTLVNAKKKEEFFEKLTQEKKAFQESVVLIKKAVTENRIDKDIDAVIIDMAEWIKTHDRRLYQLNSQPYKESKLPNDIWQLAAPALFLLAIGLFLPWMVVHVPTLPFLHVSVALTEIIYKLAAFLIPLIVYAVYLYFNKSHDRHKSYAILFAMIPLVVGGLLIGISLVTPLLASLASVSTISIFLMSMGGASMLAIVGIASPYFHTEEKIIQQTCSQEKGVLDQIIQSLTEGAFLHAQPLVAKDKELYEWANKIQSRFGEQKLLDEKEVQQYYGCHYAHMLSLLECKSDTESSEQRFNLSSDPRAFYLSEEQLQKITTNTIPDVAVLKDAIFKPNITESKQLKIKQVLFYQLCKKAGQPSLEPFQFEPYLTFFDGKRQTVLKWFYENRSSFNALHDELGFKQDSLRKIGDLDRLVADRRAYRDPLEVNGLDAKTEQPNVNIKRVATEGHLDAKRLPPHQSAGAETTDTSVKAADSNVGSVRRSSSSALFTPEQEQEPTTTRRPFS